MTEVRGQMTHLHSQYAGPTNRADDSELPSVLSFLSSVIQNRLLAYGNPTAELIIPTHDCHR